MMIKRINIVIEVTESNLSIMPPWPGSKTPESLRPCFLLKCDSNKSPRNPTMVIKKDNRINGTMPCRYTINGNTFMPGRYRILNVKIAKNPPSNPSHDLPGLIRG